MEHPQTHTTPLSNTESKGSNFFLYLVFFLFLTAVAGGMVYLYSKEFDGIEKKEVFTLPAKGENITLEKVEVVWRETMPEESQNGKLAIIPEISLSFSADSSGRVICFLSDNEGNTIGQGKTIDLDGTETFHLITGDAGYQEKSDYRSYLVSEPPYWKLIMRESVASKTVTFAEVPLLPNPLETK